MSTWQGFDQRKVCPKCREYQTRVERFQRSNLPSIRISVLAVLTVGMVILTMIVLLLSSLPVSGVRLRMLFFASLIGVGIILFHPRTKKIFKEYSQALQDYFREADKLSREHPQDSQGMGYLLTCRNCGHQWEMSSEDWETAGQRERENLINFPSFSPPRGVDPAGDYEKIEWKPPNPGRGILIVIGAATVFLIASAALFSVLWSLTHPDHSYAPVVSSLGIIIGVLVYVGLMGMFKPRRSRMIPILLLILIALTAIVLRFLVK